MMMSFNAMKICGSALAMCLAGVIGCDEPSDAVDDNDIGLLGDDDDHIDFTPVDDDVTFRTVEDNGIEGNGIASNGLRINGLRINGFLTGLVESLLSQLNQLEFQSGSLLRAWHALSGTWRVGAQLNGMTFNIDFEVDGTPHTGQMRIVSVTQSSTQPDVYFYNIQSNNSGTWVSACFDGAGNPTEAIAIQGNFDSATGARTSDIGLTWACRGAAIAKAVEWGFRPWATVDGTLLKNHHQTAVRMIRADYCGNGEHHTANGNPIDIEDTKRVQTFDSLTWPVEAAWGPTGAICLNTPRKLYWSREMINPCSNLPLCSAAHPEEVSGALLMTRAVPNSGT
jgi:hypothetical protein